MKRLAVLILLVFAGCTHAPSPPPAGYVCWSDDLAAYVPMWQHEAEQRFVDPVVFICHGGDFHGHWGFYADHPNRTVFAEPVIQTLCSAYPGRPIVVVSCNEEGYSLRAPRHGVYYATKLVYMFPPDHVLGMFCPSRCTNDVFSFVEARVE